MAQAQTANMQRGEYWIDQDLGIGMNINFNLANTPNALNVQLPISLSGYGPGIHTIGIRTLDADGNWGLTNFSKAVVIEVPPAPPADLVEVEYFLNEDPGFGNGFSAWSGSTIDAPGILFDPDMSTAHVGVNTLFVRSRTGENVWGITNHAALVVIEPEDAGVIARVEAFNLTSGPDPGFGNATPFTIDDPQIVFAGELGSDEVLPIVSGNTLAIRSVDSHGRWSLTNFIESALVIITDVEDLVADANITTYPNPFTEGITVSNKDGKPVRVVLYDPQGRLVHDKVLTGETYIDLHSLANGTYTAFFWKELERIHRVQLVKQ